MRLPALVPACMSENNGSRPDRPVHVLPCANVFDSDFVVWTPSEVLTYVQNDQGTNQSVSRDLIDSPAIGSEMGRRIQVSPVVFLGREDAGVISVTPDI